MGRKAIKIYGVNHDPMLNDNERPASVTKAFLNRTSSLDSGVWRIPNFPFAENESSLLRVSLPSSKTFVGMVTIKFQSSRAMKLFN